MPKIKNEMRPPRVCLASAHLVPTRIPTSSNQIALAHSNSGPTRFQLGSAAGLELLRAHRDGAAGVFVVLRLDHEPVAPQDLAVLVQVLRGQVVVLRRVQISKGFRSDCDVEAAPREPAGMRVREGGSG